MKLVIGGHAQGKLNYILHRFASESCLVWDGELPDEVQLQEALEQDKTVVVNHLHDWVKRRLQEGGCPEEEIFGVMEMCPDCIIISDELGNGIVPVDAFERAYRERTGRILVELASRAEEVVRVLCGIGHQIK